MRRTVLFTLLSLLVAGCVQPPAGPDDLGTPPLLDTKDAVLKQVGDTVFATWKGSVTVPGRAADTPLVPVPDSPTGVAGTFAEHAFTLPADATVMEGWLNWTDTKGALSFFVLNESGRSWCGARFIEAQAGNCFATFYMRPPGDATKWRTVVQAASYDGPTTKVDYEFTLALRNLTLPILGHPTMPGNATRWATPVLVSSDKHTGEPSIALSPGGTIWLSAPTGAQESLWRSDDGGATFTFVKVHDNPTSDPGSAYTVGGGDSDVAVATEQTLYFADQQGGTGQTVSSSHDGGKTWFTTPLAAGGPARPGAPPLPAPVPVPGVPVGIPGAYSADRQWLVTDGDMTAWLAFNSGNAADRTGRVSGATVVKTIDGGRTWGTRAFMTEDDCARGNLARSPDGTLFFAGCNNDGPGVGVSTDGGQSFEWHLVAKRDGETKTGFGFPMHIFVVVTTDAAGNAYVVWSDEAQTPEATGAPAGGALGLNVWLSSSKDKGKTWSVPKKVNQMEGTFVEPWVTAGAEGQVVVVSYGTKFAGNPERAMGEWYVVSSVTGDATVDAPVWTESVASDIVQYGPICMRGSACGNARNLLDFFQVQADQTGKLHVAYVDGRAGGNARNSNLMYVQSAGPVLGGPSVDKSG